MDTGVVDLMAGFDADLFPLEPSRFMGHVLILIDQTIRLISSDRWRLPHSIKGSWKYSRIPTQFSIINNA